MNNLQDYLRQIKNELSPQLDEIWKKAKKGIHDAIHTKEGHQGGAPHSEAVENNAWRLIGSQNTTLMPIELFVLSVAAALHDAGRAPFGEDYELDLDHGELSEKRIRQRAVDFGLDEHQALVVGYVVRPHNNGNLLAIPNGWPLSPYGNIEIRKLAALLRLADMLHIAGRVSRQVLNSEELSGKDRKKTLFRELVSDWQLVENGQAICLYGIARNMKSFNKVLILLPKT